MKRTFFISGCCAVIGCGYVRADEMGGFQIEIAPGENHENLWEENEFNLPEYQEFSAQPDILPETPAVKDFSTYEREASNSNYFFYEDTLLQSQPYLQQNHNIQQYSDYFQQETLQGNLSVPPSPLPTPTAMAAETSEFIILTPAATEIPTFSPTVTPLQLAAETPVPTVTPAEKRKMKPVKTGKKIQEKEMDICYFSSTIQTNNCNTIGLRIVSEKPMYIFSVRVDQKERKWHWEGESIIIEVGTQRQNGYLELLSICEKKDKIQVFVDDRTN